MDRSDDPTRHPSPAAFEQLALGQEVTDETRLLVRHLLSGCPACRRELERTRQASPSPAELTYDEVFERLERRLSGDLGTLARERKSAPELYRELLAHEAIEGLLQLQSTRRFSSLALCELLLEKSRALQGEDEEQAQKAATLAVGVAEQLDLEIYGAPVVQDARAIAWAYLADSQRLAADLASAEKSLRLAAALLAQGSGEPRHRAEIHALEASLCLCSGRFVEAVARLNQAATIYRRAGDDHLLGRTLLKKATAIGNAGDPRAAVRLIRRAIERLDPAREPRLAMVALHNLVWFLAEGGLAGQAAASLDAARRCFERARDRRQLGRLRWLEGKLAGDLATAEEALRGARDALAREGLPYEAALAGMDLAVRYAGERRSREMWREAERLLPLFRSREMYGETALALLSFRQSETPGEVGRLLEELEARICLARERQAPKALPPAR